jgi:hypothetical protein
MFYRNVLIVSSNASIKITNFLENAVKLIRIGFSFKHRYNFKKSKFFIKKKVCSKFFNNREF